MARKNILTGAKKKKAIALVQERQLQQAKELYQQICKTDPADAEAWFNLGAVNGMLGQHAEAADCLRRAVALRPRHAESHYNLGISLREQGNFAEAVEAFRIGVTIQPDYTDAQECFAHALIALDRIDEAIEAFQSALKIYPSKAEAHIGLGSLYQVKGLLHAAEACYREAIRLKPGIAIAYDNLGSVLASQGRHEESIILSREGLRRNPDDLHAHSNLLLTLNYLPCSDQQKIFEEHRLWGVVHGCANPRNWKSVNEHNIQRRLRVGYVSQDFRSHSVACYIEPLLKAHDRSTVELYCYAHVPRPDAITMHLRSLSDHWRNIAAMTDEQAVEQIRADEIDILVDLAGHTGGSRLRLFAFKPAPIQVTYLGYPNTTGLTTIDYRLTDNLADPAGQDQFYTEELWRLPGCFLCYQPLADAPAVVPPPCGEAGFVTFGSFNNLAKLNDRVIELWSEILRAVPSARLLLKNHSLTDPDTRERYREAFVRRDIPRERLDLIGHTSSRGEHLALYGRVDIALDTFPYNGTTTTCEALWMGVPVITLAGQTHAGRVALSLLSVLQLQELVADSVQSYVALAAALANDQAKLAHLRATLRERMQYSPFCNGRNFAQKIEAAYREMWQRWCRR